MRKDKRRFRFGQEMFENCSFDLRDVYNNISEKLNELKEIYPYSVSLDLEMKKNPFNRRIIGRAIGIVQREVIYVANEELRIVSFGNPQETVPLKNYNRKVHWERVYYVGINLGRLNGNIGDFVREAIEAELSKKGVKV